MKKSGQAIFHQFTAVLCQTQPKTWPLSFRAQKTINIYAKNAESFKSFPTVICFQKSTDSEKSMKKQ